MNRISLTFDQYAQITADPSREIVLSPEQIKAIRRGTSLTRAVRRVFADLDLITPRFRKKGRKDDPYHLRSRRCLQLAEWAIAEMVAAGGIADNKATNPAGKTKKRKAKKGKTQAGAGEAASASGASAGASGASAGAAGASSDHPPFPAIVDRGDGFEEVITIRLNGSARGVVHLVQFNNLLLLYAHNGSVCLRIGKVGFEEDNRQPLLATLQQIARNAVSFSLEAPNAASSGSSTDAGSTDASCSTTDLSDGSGGSGGSGGSASGSSGSDE